METVWASVTHISNINYYVLLEESSHSLLSTGTDSSLKNIPEDLTCASLTAKKGYAESCTKGW